MTQDYPAKKEKKLLEQMRDAIRLRNYSYRTEKSYLQWAKRFILFHKKRHPSEMGRAEVEAFLTHLAVAGDVAARTQRFENDDDLCPGGQSRRWGAESIG